MRVSCIESSWHMSLDERTEWLRVANIVLNALSTKGAFNTKIPA